MIVVCLKGGLGNQLFQYAAGRRLALARGAQLKLDLTGFDAFGEMRQYALGVFATIQTAAAPRDLPGPPAAPAGRSWRRRLRPGSHRPHGPPPPAVVAEKHFHFDPAIMDLPDHIYLDGYWQTERYFADAAAVIRREVQVRDMPDGRNAEVLAAIEQSNSVAVHVRRGDYASVPAFLEYHGLCAPDYYHQAVAWIRGHTASPRFFLFSDDPAWTRASLAIPNAVVVDHNSPGYAYEDLRLMSRCRHHIIANSTFSWWGAWLGQWEGQCVCAPRRWYQRPDVDTRDVIPPRWHRI
jgi:hypothetical protein